MKPPGGRFVDPFGQPYFEEALRAGETLGGAPSRRRVAGYEIVRQVDGPHATILVGRGQDGALRVLKGFRANASVGPVAQTIRENEALRMLRLGWGGIVPIEETLSLVGDATIYLCMPYCQGGSLRDRLLAKDMSIAELAYHGLAVANAMHKIHAKGLVHCDIKPDNILFAHVQDFIEIPGWRTWLSDLETLSAAGGPTSWRMTPEYAAPEQIDGAAAAPAIDVWAWGATMRDGLGESLPREWHWLADLVERTRSAEPANRPSAQEIVATYSRHVGFGDAEQPYMGAAASTAAAWYPLESLLPFRDPWPRTSDLSVFWMRASFGWSAWLPECARLYEIGTVMALTRISDLSIRVLGDPADPTSVWRSFHAMPTATVFPVGSDARVTMRIDGDPAGSEVTMDLVPRQVALSFVRHLTVALVELVETVNADADIERLRVVAEAWESIGEFESEVDTAVLAQAWLVLDEPDRALPYVRRAYRADPSNFSALAAMRMFYLVTGDHGMAASVAVQGAMAAKDDMILMLRWRSLLIVDLLEAGRYDELDEILNRSYGTRIDIVDLIKCVLAGRRGAVRSDVEWSALREHFTTVSSNTSVQKIGYLVEAAYQRGDVEYARRRAAIVRTRPVIRLPINHQVRATIEAVALGRDPADRGVAARLNNRAEHWSNDGRPTDPLTGLCLVAAQRWVSGAGRAHASTSARELLNYSRGLFAERFRVLLHSTRHCAKCRAAGKVGHMLVCGNCHQVFCADCALLGPPGHTQRCRGALTHP